MKTRRADSPAWLEAKRVGDESEALVARFLQSRGADVLRYCGQANADLEARWTFEVKHDRIAEASGRVAVEVERDGEPSGIATTGAWTWFFHVGDEIYLIDVRTLRDLLAQGSFESVAAGDGKRSRVKLVPLADLRRVARAVVPVGAIP